MTWLNKIIHGDCLEIMKQIPDGVIDLVVTDPPYSLGFEIANDDLSYDEQKQFSGKYLIEIFRVMKQNATLCIFSSPEFSHFLYHSIIETGFEWKNDIVWHRDRGHSITKQLAITNEIIIVATKGNIHKTFNLDEIRVKSVYEGKDKRLNPKGKNPGTVWYVPPLIGKKKERITKNGKAIHPTQKPEEIILPLIIAYSNENDIILDPFTGLGTIPLIAKEENRRFIGIDISKEYCDLALQRIEVEE